VGVSRLAEYDGLASDMYRLFPKQKHCFKISVKNESVVKLSLVSINIILNLHTKEWADIA
jgi:hypothetical protein